MATDPATIMAIATAARVGAEITAAAAELMARVGTDNEPTAAELEELGVRLETRGDRMTALYNERGV